MVRRGAPNGNSRFGARVSNHEGALVMPHGDSHSSKIATARVQPAEAPRILCGKQEM
jgi:hypothetical protein